MYITYTVFQFINYFVTSATGSHICEMIGIMVWLLWYGLLYCVLSVLCNLLETAISLTEPPEAKRFLSLREARFH